MFRLTRHFRHLRPMRSPGDSASEACTHHHHHHLVLLLVLLLLLLSLVVVGLVFLFLVVLVFLVAVLLLLRLLPYSHCGSQHYSDITIVFMIVVITAVCNRCPRLRHHHHHHHHQSRRRHKVFSSCGQLLDRASCCKCSCLSSTSLSSRFRDRLRFYRVRRSACQTACIRSFLIVLNFIFLVSKQQFLSRGTYRSPQ